MILKQLGIFGWKEADESLVLASLLTGHPLLLIGNHGCAKTDVANKVAQALGVSGSFRDAILNCWSSAHAGNPRLARLVGIPYFSVSKTPLVSQQIPISLLAISGCNAPGIYMGSDRVWSGRTARLKKCVAAALDVPGSGHATTSGQRDPTATEHVRNGSIRWPYL